MAYGEHETARYVDEPSKASPAHARTAFERDRARVLHSSALRRLAGKTQVVAVPDDSADDFPRTRLTHSLECAQIGRELAAALGADADLVDTACLAHDIGHPPFGHNGETALDEAAAACGGFEGNAQSLRLLTRLEPKVAGAGLNLTRATLDAALKYPWPKQGGRRKYGVYDDDLAVFTWVRDGASADRRSFEAQVMDWADDVAYSVHDLEDGVHSGEVVLARLDRDAVCEATAGTYSPLPASELRALLDALLAEPWLRDAQDLVALKRATSELIARFTGAAVRATRAEHGDEALTRYEADLVVPARAAAECALLKGVTAAFVMSRPDTVALQVRQREQIAELVAAVVAGAPGTLEPVTAAAWKDAADDPARLRACVDRVAGLTDRAALRLHEVLTG
ncbi:MAG TPA: deoxyguanosinetriphosphate triphosphohydrolase [Mycobacteriales bacterium]|nr:deoxyguanosinetriphosphate triphosphohydrolase [Mycobacteriales bacterium]